MLQDIVYGLRMIRKNLAVTIVTVFTLALAIAANTIIFGMTNALLLKSQPGVGEAARLVDLGRTRTQPGTDTFGAISYPNYLDYSRRTDVFSGVLGYTQQPVPISFRNTGEAERVYGCIVTANFFDVLEVRPKTGRFFRPEEDRPNAVPVAVISDAFLEGRFASDAGIVGRGDRAERTALHDRRDRAGRL